MSPLEIALLVVVLAAVGYKVVGWMFNKDTEIEDRRRGAAKLAAVLQSYGLRKIPDVLIDYSVGDYSGFARRIKQIAEMFVAGEKAVIEEFDEVFEKVLGEKLKTEAGRTLIGAKLMGAARDGDAITATKAPLPVNGVKTVS